MVKHLVALTTRFVPRHHLQRVAAVALKTLGVFYLGSRFEDPISGRTYRKLLPYGRTAVRENALAPHSMSLERHRLIWLYLRNQTTFFTEPHRVLHIAPEYCFLKVFKKLRNLDYVTADLVSPWADVKLDVQEIPFPDSRFDVIICNHVLEHVESDLRAMREIFRVLRPGGFAILQVPMDLALATTLEDPAINTPVLREHFYRQRDHLRLYGRDYPCRLRSAGFTVEENNYLKTLPAALAERYALPKDEILYICRKS